jgi:hypothetical protein
MRPDHVTFGTLIKGFALQGKLHSKRVGKIPKNYTRKEWTRLKSTLETSGEDEKVHSKRVEKMEKYTRNEWRR